MQLPAEFRSELAPLFITAPTTRCGTTLLQRLLCSSKNAIVFGETVAGDFQVLLRLQLGKAAIYDMHRHHFDQRLEAFRQRKVNDWILDLTPESELYIASIAASAAAPLAACRASAEREGRAVYGVKYPGWLPDDIRLIAQFLPRARWIYIHRDLLACARSAKARDEFDDLAGLEQFCGQWASNMTVVPELASSPSFLVLDYETLRRDAEATIDRIAAFTGIEGIDRAVMQHRVNDAAGYIAPAELTHREMEVVQRYSGA